MRSVAFNVISYYFTLFFLPLPTSHCYCIRGYFAMFFVPLMGLLVEPLAARTVTSFVFAYFFISNCWVFGLCLSATCGVVVVAVFMPLHVLSHFAIYKFFFNKFFTSAMVFDLRFVFFFVLRHHATNKSCEARLSSAVGQQWWWFSFFFGYWVSQSPGQPIVTVICWF